MMECLKGEYNQERAASWVFSHLYRYAIDQANATYSLLVASHISSGFQLWRSLFETHVICEFISKNLSNSVLLQDYICHNLLLSWIRMKKDANEFSRLNNRQQKYDDRDIEYLKDLYRSKGWVLNDEHAWARSVFQNMPSNKPCRFADIRKRVNSDLSVFYRISSREVHPNLEQQFVSLGTYLPIPAVPMILFNTVESREIQLDYLTAKVLHRMTGRADSFLSLSDEMSNQLKRLEELGRQTLQECKESTTPVLSGMHQCEVQGSQG